METIGKSLGHRGLLQRTGALQAPYVYPEALQAPYAYPEATTLVAHPQWTPLQHDRMEYTNGK